MAMSCKETTATTGIEIMISMKMQPDYNNATYLQAFLQFFATTLLSIRGLFVVTLHYSIIAYKRLSIFDNNW
jgi:hypothetical protein